MLLEENTYFNKHDFLHDVCCGYDVKRWKTLSMAKELMVHIKHVIIMLFQMRLHVGLAKDGPLLFLMDSLPF